MNSWPGTMARLSVLTASNATSAPTTRPFSGVASSLKCSGLSILDLPGIQRLGGLIQIGERVANAGDLLVILVTFAGQQHDIADPGGSNQAGNGFTTGRNEGHGFWMSKADANIVDDLRARLGARVVIG